MIVEWSDNVISLLTKENKNAIESISLFQFVFRSFLIFILFFLVIFFFIITFYFVDFVFNSNKGSFRKPLFGAYIIVSQSMLPTIKVNDAVVVKRIDNDNYKVGDIITFISKDTNYKGLKVTHRIVKKENVSKNKSLYTTKGDNNPVNDATLVSTDSIYGKVLFRIPKVGKIKAFFSNPVHYFVCLLIPAILFIIYEITRIYYMILSTKES